MPSLVAPDAILERNVKPMHLVLVVKFAVVQLRILHVSCREATAAASFEILLVRLEEDLDVRAVTHEVHLRKVDPHLCSCVD